MHSRPDYRKSEDGTNVLTSGCRHRLLRTSTSAGPLCLLQKIETRELASPNVACVVHARVPSTLYVHLSPHANEQRGNFPKSHATSSTEKIIVVKDATHSVLDVVVVGQLVGGAVLGPAGHLLVVAVGRMLAAPRVLAQLVLHINVRVVLVLAATDGPRPRQLAKRGDFAALFAPRGIREFTARHRRFGHLSSVVGMPC